MYGRGWLVSSDLHNREFPEAQTVLLSLGLSLRRYNRPLLVPPPWLFLQFSLHLFFLPLLVIPLQHRNLVVPRASIINGLHGNSENSSNSGIRAPAPSRTVSSYNPARRVRLAGQDESQTRREGVGLSCSPTAHPTFRTGCAASTAQNFLPGNY